MDPHTLIPSPDTIPVAANWFQFLLLLTFTIHLLLMNILIGCGFIAWVDETNNQGGEAAIGRLLAGKLPYVIALTINFGVAPLLFLQVLYGSFIYVSSVLMAWIWLSVVGLLILAYYWAYLYKYGYERYPLERSRLIGFSLLLFAVVAFIFVNNMTLMLRPESWSRDFAQPTGILLNLSDPMLWPRYLHFMTASVAIGGLALAVLAQVKKEPPERLQLGLRWFCRATLVQLLVGGWYFWQLAGPVQQLFLGGLTWATICLAAGVSFAILALLTAWRQLVWPTAIFALATVTFMVVVRDIVRRALLSPYFSISELTVAPQYSVFYLFLAILLVGLVIIGIMLKWAADARQNGEVIS